VDVAEAVEWIMFGIFWTNGQICSATSRALIHENIYDKVIERLAQEAKKITVGGTLFLPPQIFPSPPATPQNFSVNNFFSTNSLDPFTDKDPSMGPVVNSTQFKKILHYFETAKKEGATVLTGGKAAHSKGYFIEPTVFTNVTENMTIWKEEIFGPVLAVKKFLGNFLKYI
jgi:betaine-aldehyde dehydrogenase